MGISGLRVERRLLVGRARGTHATPLTLSLATRRHLLPMAAPIRVADGVLGKVEGKHGMRLDEELGLEPHEFLTQMLNDYDRIRYQKDRGNYVLTKWFPDARSGGREAIATVYKGDDGKFYVTDTSFLPRQRNYAKLTGPEVWRRPAGAPETLPGDAVPSTDSDISSPLSLHQPSSSEAGQVEAGGQTSDSIIDPNAETLYQRNGAAAPAKGSVTIPKGFGVSREAGKAIIRLFEHGDVSTLVHESFHLWRRTLMDEDRAIVEKWLKVENGQWTEAQEERFARAGERYLMKGGTPPGRPELAGIFLRFKNWLRAIYHSVKVSPELDVNIPAEVRDTYDRMFDKETAKTPRLRDQKLRAELQAKLAEMDPHDPRPCI